MLYYGFDIEDQLAVALDPANDIASATGIALGSGSEPLAYIVQAQMPLLTEFLFVDPTTEVASPDAVETNQYSTHSYSQLPALPEDYEAYYGFRLRYGFSEPINSATGYLGTTSYDYPDHGSYLQGAGTSTLLAHAKTELSGSPDSDLPITNTTAYDTFFVDGSLVHPQDPDVNTTWDHLAYLGDDQADFDEDTAEHSFTILASQSYDYMDGSLSTTYEDTLPILLGGYDLNAFYTPATKSQANLFLDAYGNPARVASAWLLEPTVEGNSTLSITYDRSRPNLLSASALNIADTDEDGNVDNFTGSFGEFSDQVTFEFALTFDREMDESSLASGVFWDVDTNSTANLGTPTQSVSAVNISGTDYIYTFTYAVDEGVYAAAGTYAIAFDENTLATDPKTNPIDPDAANLILEDNLCLAGTCQFLNNPVSLEAATVDPGGVAITQDDTTYAAAFNVTFTFSAPVTFTADINDLLNVEIAFDLNYVDEDGDEILSTSGNTYTGATIAGLAPIAASDDGSGHYTEYQLSINDTSGFWARSNYLTGAIGIANSAAYIFFEQLADELGTGTIFTDSFVTADGAQVTIPSAIQDGDASSGTSTIEYLLLADFTLPSIVSAEPVAASNDDNIQGDSSNLRHVQFELDSADAASGIGIHLLFRTTDAAFTNGNSSTAPYYGAEGGIYISNVDGNNGYHICPPFNKHIERVSAGMQHPDLWTYNDRAQIHYLAIPYAASVDDYLVDDADISTYQPFTVDFSAEDILNNTEPCVRTAFYNDGAGQYGYIVDSDQEEQHMVIANAMLQDANGSQADLAMLDPDQLHNVYFDLYAKDYYADSWRRDLRLTAQDLIAELTAANLQNDSLHDDDGLSYQIDRDHLSIFASRFVNTINARFLDSVFLDTLSKDDTPVHHQHSDDKMDELVNSPPFNQITSTQTSSSSYLYWQIQTPEDYFTPNFRNRTPDVLVDKNDNRLVLSIGVHPSAISVDPNNGGFFQPFESDQANFLKMDPAFYGLYYGGVANTTEPAFDYTSRHLAYVNFDLVYELDIDPGTEEIQAANLVRIVSPFSLLKHSFFSTDSLEEIRDKGQSYTAVAASIADNVFRHNFYGTSGDDLVQHFLPVGIYCYDPNGEGGICQNDHAQMLLPDPNDAANGYERTIVSPHYLHRTVLHFNASASNTALQSYSINSADDDGFASSNPGSLLQNFIRLNDGMGASGSYFSKLKASEALPGAIGNYAYHSMLYNSFDRDHGYDYTYASGSENFASEIAMDGNYTTGEGTKYQGFEQQYWGVSPYAESPDARADQILPNAFLLGGQMLTPYHHTFLVKPYQFTGFTQQINARLTDPDYLFNKNITLRGLTNGMTYDDIENPPFTGANSLDLYPNFVIPNSGFMDDTTNVVYHYVSSINYRRPYLHVNRTAASMTNFYAAHIINTSSSYYQNAINFYAPFNELNDNSSRQLYDSAQLSLSLPIYFSGRYQGFYNTDTNIDEPRYGLMEYFTEPNSAGHTQVKMGFRYRTDEGATYDTNAYNSIGSAPSISESYDGNHYVAILHDSYLYDDAGKQRMFLPHHADDYDFDRGQIMANKLGFFLDDGVILQTYLDNDWERSSIYRRLFFPSDPALITPETQDVDYVVTNFDLDGLGEVSNYYPLVLSEESLHTAANSWPVLLTHHDYALTMAQKPDSTTEAFYISGLDYRSGQSEMMVQFDSVRRTYAAFPMPLDKIFPEGYRYQLGFVNREELFMYDPSVGNGDLSTSPVINRFYSSAVGNFGYATQYNRLNRRSMQGYHNITSSQFLGDHLARFESEPTSGIHTPSDLDSVFDHTPVKQGATGTNYGSYREGHYDLTTEQESQLSGTWRHRTYTGTLRGYVLELRTNPIYTNQIEDYTTSTNANFITSYDSVPNPAVTRLQDLSGTGHPDGRQSKVKC